MVARHSRREVQQSLLAPVPAGAERLSSARTASEEPQSRSSGNRRCRVPSPVWAQAGRTRPLRHFPVFDPMTAPLNELGGSSYPLARKRSDTSDDLHGHPGQTIRDQRSGCPHVALHLRVERALRPPRVNPYTDGMLSFPAIALDGRSTTDGWRPRRIGRSEVQFGSDRARSLNATISRSPSGRTPRSCC
jgi:hypothetical protein